MHFLEHKKLIIEPCFGACDLMWLDLKAASSVGWLILCGWLVIDLSRRPPRPPCCLPEPESECKTRESAVALALKTLAPVFISHPLG